MKHILLATSGTFPQVVTETLFALHSQGPWPDEIYLITSECGKQMAQLGLLEQGHLARLCDELQRPIPLFKKEHILVVHDAQNQPMGDAHSWEDQEFLGDFIMTKVRNFTADDDNGQPRYCVWASLAGGRKTMTFYLGYAMSLFGRHQDRLTHVLVTEDYEGLPDFWYPSQTQSLPLHRRDGQLALDQQGEPLRPSQARITLVDIPFLRHRHSLPKVLLQSTDNPLNFRSLIRWINLGSQQEKLQLLIDLPNKKIIVKDTEQQVTPLEFIPTTLVLAFYTMMARATCNQDSTLYRPSGYTAQAAGEILRERLLNELMPLEELPRTAPVDHLKGVFREDTLKMLRHPIPYTWFDQRRRDCRQLFESRLPPTICDLISPEILWDEDGKRLDPYGNKPKGGGYGLHIMPKNIAIHECPPLDKEGLIA